MDLKHTIVKNPVLVAAVVVIVFSLAFLAWPASAPVARPSVAASSFYTTDDGSSWFTDTADKLPPFDHDGKPAVRCYVFTCDGGKTKFVGYLERYTEVGKARVEAAKHPTTQPMAAPGPASGYPGVDDIEIKRPKGEWVSQSDPAKAQSITQIHCPDGGGTVEPVLP